MLLLSLSHVEDLISHTTRVNCSNHANALLKVRIGLICLFVLIVGKHSPSELHSQPHVSKLFRFPKQQFSLKTEVRCGSWAVMRPQQVLSQWIRLENATSAQPKLTWDMLWRRRAAQASRPDGGVSRRAKGLTTLKRKSKVIKCK